MCAFLRYWAGLQNESDRANLMEGADRVQGVAIQAQEMARQVAAGRLAQGAEDEEGDVTVD